MLGDFPGLEFQDGLIGEGGQGCVDFGLVFKVGGDDEINVVCLSRVAGTANGEAANNDVVCAKVVQMTAKLQEILDTGTSRD